MRCFPFSVTWNVTQQRLVGFLGCRVGEATNPGPRSDIRRRRFVSSSDDDADDAVGANISERATEAVSDAPLVSPNPVSVEVVDALERDLVVTQWDSIPSMGPEFQSGT